MIMWYESALEGSVRKARKEAAKMLPWVMDTDPWVVELLAVLIAKEKGETLRGLGALFSTG